MVTLTFVLDVTNKHEQPFCNNTVGNMLHRRSAMAKCFTY